MGSTGASGMQLELNIPTIGSILFPNALCRLKYAFVTLVGCLHRPLRID